MLQPNQLNQPIKKIVLASNNTGKLKEINALFQHVNIDVLPQSHFAIEDADETGSTFVENALIKAKHAAKISGLPALADDSGLVVPALGGAPGIYSGRYAGQPQDDHNNNAKLLAKMQDITDRQAMFVCLLTLCLSDTHPLPIIAEGIWQGEITQYSHGNGGFGYDPLFFVPTHKMTSAELDRTEKNRISHRGLAIQNLLSKLKTANRISN